MENGEILLCYNVLFTSSMKYMHTYFKMKENKCFVVLKKQHNSQRIFVRFFPITRGRVGLDPHPLTTVNNTTHI